jgi:hypothetical protein
MLFSSLLTFLFLYVIIGMFAAADANVSSSSLYPFGIDVGDSSGPFTDCSTGYSVQPLTVNPGFNFFDQTFSQIYVSSCKSFVIIFFVSLHFQYHHHHHFCTADHSILSILTGRHTIFTDCWLSQMYYELSHIHCLPRPPVSAVGNGKSDLGFFEGPNCIAFLESDRYSVSVCLLAYYESLA